MLIYQDKPEFQPIRILIQTEKERNFILSLLQAKPETKIKEVPHYDADIHSSIAQSVSNFKMAARL